MKQTNIASVVYIIAAALLTANSLPAQSVIDGGFETPAVNTLLFIGGAQTFDYNATTPVYLDPTLGTTGWYLSAGTNGQPSVTLINQGALGVLISPLTGDASSQYLVLNGLTVALGVITPDSTRGGASESLTTVVGQSYQVNYTAGALSLGLGTTSTPQLNAGVDGVTVTSPSGGALVNLNIGTFSNNSFTFTATSTSSVLDFSETPALGANVGGIAIDGVSITPVPEPSQYAAIFLSLALALMISRRFRSKFSAPVVA